MSQRGGKAILKKIRAVALLSVIFTLILTSFYGSDFFVTALSPDIGSGKSSDDIIDMQQRLKNWGYFSGNIDGCYGTDTTAAVKNYQKAHNLKESGIADADTIEAMGLTKIAQPGTVYAEGEGIGEEQLLARAINGEARGESYIGQVAVGAVILNRTRDSRFPKTVAGVIYQPGAFTAVSDGQINTPLDPNSTVVKAARDALNGWDPTGGCVYYWNPATATSSWIWSRQIVTKIGKHNFAK